MSSTGHATTCDTESDRYAADCRGDASTASCACGSDLWPAPCALECHCRCQRVAYIRHAACERIVMSVLAPQAPRTRLVIVACRWHARCLTSQSTAEAYARFCRGERGAWRRPQVGTAGLGLQPHLASDFGRMAVALSLDGPCADAFVLEARHFAITWFAQLAERARISAHTLRMRAGGTPLQRAKQRRWVWMVLIIQWLLSDCYSLLASVAVIPSGADIKKSAPRIAPRGAS